MEHQAPVGSMRWCHVHKVNVEHQAPVGSMRWYNVHKVNVEHHAPGSAQCVGVMYTRLMWNTMHQDRLNALVSCTQGTCGAPGTRIGSMRWCHVHNVNVEHQAPGSAQCASVMYTKLMWSTRHQDRLNALVSCTQG